MMTRRTLAVAASLVLVAAVFTAAATAMGDLRVFVNGDYVSFDVQPRLEDGRALAPIRQVAEALGARVEWDPTENAVRITSSGFVQGERRIHLLESALAPLTPEQAVNTWANAVKMRNGAAQFAVLSPALRSAYRGQLEEIAWVTGVSSPWVERYEVPAATKIGDDSYAYDVKFHMATSMGPEGVDSVRVYVEKPPARPGEAPGEEYRIAQIYRPSPVSLQQLGCSVALPSDWQVRDPAAAEVEILGPSRETLGAAQVLGGLFLPNHSATQSEETIDGQPGKKVYLLTLSQPAASGSAETWQELHGFIARSDGSYADVWLRVNAGCSIDVQKDLFKRIISSVVLN
ncbi:MAG: stalk domain-containing protein [Ignavibacteriales bacterium]